MTVQVHQFPCLDDNYGFLIRDEDTGAVACIDTPDADAILAEAANLGWDIGFILNTHWHPDHAGGNAAIRAATSAQAIGPSEVEAHFPIDRVVDDGDVIEFGETPIRVIDSGGHTLGHVVLYLEGDGLLFAGDTLFPMGCGRIFEGTAEQMWASISRIAALPADTVVYSAHEYTLGNASFALSIDDSPAVAERYAQIVEARRLGAATVPTTIAMEVATNPFLRAQSLSINSGEQSAAAAFARVRAAKDNFRG